MRLRRHGRWLLCTVCLWTASASADDPAALRVQPEAVQLDAGSPRQQLIVSSGSGDDLSPDLTRAATFVSESPEIVGVDATGIVRPLATGTGTVLVTVGDAATRVAVEVGSLAVQPVDFDRDIQPILTRFGCNAGACHGKQRGQNGFQLSLLGFDSDFDHNAIVKEARGRRIVRAAPESSLILQKPSGVAPHGGGLRLPLGGDEYRLLLRWINEGATRSLPDMPLLEQVTVAPTRRSMLPAEQQQLIVTAHYSDGSTRDVTALATYQSNESVTAAVDERGLVTAGTVVGEVAVMARYLGHFAVCQVALPLEGDVSPDAYA
ncbi:MAG: S-layer protein, partial [Planctomycetaceae bacterium]|nr:S-layer protein [Planctomycetaceae bacterium]